MMFGVGLRSSRNILKAPDSSGRSAKIRHTSPPLMAGRSLPYRADSDSIPWLGTAGGGLGEGAAGAPTGGRAATGGGAVGKPGSSDAGPEGGARLTAAPG